uniref:Uncharacterized protein n=1 Tax=Lotharella globosa TaxID=91324 RepID=A0A7S3YCR5_9EUKA
MDHNPGPPNPKRQKPTDPKMNRGSVEEEDDNVLEEYPILHSDVQRRAIDLGLVESKKIEIGDYQALCLEVKKFMKSRNNLYVGDMMTPQELESIAPPIKPRGKRERLGAIFSRDFPHLEMLYDTIHDAVQVQIDLKATRDCGMCAPPEDKVYKLREVDAKVYLTNETVRIEVDSEEDLDGREPKSLTIAIINGYEGYFPHAIYEGNRMGILGEVLLIYVGYKEQTNSHSYVSVMGGGGGPYISVLQTREPITAGIYGVCSGGDPGFMYAVSPELVMDVDLNQMQWKRDRSFEEKYHIGNADVAKLVDMYLSTTKSCRNRSFGYHERLKELLTQGIKYDTIQGRGSINISEFWLASKNPRKGGGNYAALPVTLDLASLPAGTRCEFVRETSSSSW